MKRYILACTIAILANNASAITVFDPKAATNAAKQLLETKRQLEQMKAQVEQLKSTYNSFNGTRNIVDLLKNPVIISKLPATYQEFYNGVKNAKNDKWAMLYKLSEDNKEYKASTSSDLKKAYDKALNDYSSAVEKSFDDTAKRLKTLDNLTNKITISKDPKEIADLQARIASEQAGIAIDKTRMDLLKEIKLIKQESLRENANNEWNESLDKPFKSPTLKISVK